MAEHIISIVFSKTVIKLKSKSDTQSHSLLLIKETASEEWRCLSTKLGKKQKEFQKEFACRRQFAIIYFFFHYFTYKKLY